MVKLQSTAVVLSMKHFDNHFNDSQLFTGAYSDF